MVESVTLRRVLTQPKPPVSCRITTNRHTVVDSWPELDTRNITLWNDFNLYTLNQSYSHILDLEIPRERLAVLTPEQKYATVEIVIPSDVNHLIRRTNEVVGPALNIAKEHLNLHNGVDLRCRVPASDDTAIVIGPRDVKATHVIELGDNSDLTLVIGLGRPGLVFDARMLASRPEHVRNEAVRPLRQLANVCKLQDTRYGYIQTDQDLIACRFSEDMVTSARGSAWRHVLKVAIMPIPWTKYSESQLTTDLALWWLSMLAMSAPHNRKIVREERVIGLNEWEDCYVGNGRGWVRRHKYSGFEDDPFSSIDWNAFDAA